MKKIALLALVALIVFACSQPKKKQAETKTEPVKEEVVLSVDDVLAKAADLAGQEVKVKGTVMHVCKHGGQRCFLMGSTEEVTIRVEAGDEIGAFTQEQMGSDLEIKGVLTEVLTEADAHNPGKEHGEEDHEHDDESEEAHQQLAANQDAAEKVYFIKGKKVVEL